MYLYSKLRGILIHTGICLGCIENCTVDCELAKLKSNKTVSGSVVKVYF